TARTIDSSRTLPANSRSIRPSLAPTPSSDPSSRSNSRSSMRPSSNANSSSRARRLPRKAPMSASGFSPSASQKALKETSRLPVLPPPQSTSRPRRASLATGDLFGQARELQHALAELLAIGVVGGTREGALVVALHEHHRLPQRERRVPAHV